MKLSGKGSFVQCSGIGNDLLNRCFPVYENFCEDVIERGFYFLFSFLFILVSFFFFFFFL